MGKRPTFALPADLKLELTADSISVDYDGDVILSSSLGRRLGTVRAGGDLTIDLPTVQGDLLAGGRLTVLGEVDGGGMIHAREVVLGRAAIRCRSISAEERITIGPANITADVIIAPEIQLDPKATGRVTVIESGNERGATKIKGGFSLSDYEDMFGNSREFLAQRGLAPLGTEHHADPATVATPVPAPAKDDEDVEDPLSLSLDDLEPLVEHGESKAGRPDELYQRLSDALGRITACYDGAEVPPAVLELRGLVEQRDYEGLREQITEVWNGLLSFHQRRGIRPHHQVTHAFNVIHGLVQ